MDTLEHRAATRRLNARQVGDGLLVKAEVLNQLSNLPHTAGDGIATVERRVAEEHVEASLHINEARLPESLGHGELVQVGVERDVGGLGLIGQCHAITPCDKARWAWFCETQLLSRVALRACYGQNRSGSLRHGRQIAQ